MLHPLPHGGALLLAACPRAEVANSGSRTGIKRVAVQITGTKMPTTTGTKLLKITGTKLFKITGTKLPVSPMTTSTGTTWTSAGAKPTVAQTTSAGTKPTSVRTAGTEPMRARIAGTKPAGTQAWIACASAARIGAVSAARLGCLPLQHGPSTQLPVGTVRAVVMKQGGNSASSSANCPTSLATQGAQGMFNPWQPVQWVLMLTRHEWTGSSKSVGTATLQA